MARIPLPEIGELNDEQKRQYGRFPANLTRALLVTTCSTQGYLSLGASFPAGGLCNRDREMIILRVGAMSKSAYERMQHYPLAIRAGWSEEEIAAIERGEAFSERDAAILRFVGECVERVKVSRETFAAVRAIYDDAQIAELTLMIGHYMMTARFLETLEVDLDDGATSWDAISVE